MTGVELDIIGQASLWLAFNNLKGAKELKVLIARQEVVEILITLDSLMEWSIIPKDFPMPKDPKQKIERFRSVKEQTPVKLLDIRDRQGSIISHLKL